MRRPNLLPLVLALMLAPMVSVWVEWAVPDEVAGKPAGLNEDQRAFIESGAALDTTQAEE